MQRRYASDIAERREGVQLIHERYCANCPLRGGNFVRMSKGERDGDILGSFEEATPVCLYFNEVCVYQL